MIGHYDKYVKERYQDDADLRAKYKAASYAWLEKAKESEEYKQKRREYSKAYYERNKAKCQEVRRNYAATRRMMMQGTVNTAIMVN